MICIVKTKGASKKGLLYLSYAQVTANSEGSGVSKAKSVEGEYETEIDCHIQLFWLPKSRFFNCF